MAHIQPDHKSFLISFSRRLLVGPPKREEILAELKTHLDDLGANDPTTLGDPKALARQYNETHVGLLGSYPRMFGLVMAAGLLIWTLDFINWTGWNTYWKPEMRNLSSLNGYVPQWLILYSNQEMWIKLLLPMLVAFILGWVLPRVWRNGRLVMMLLICGWLTGTLFGSITSWYRGADYENTATGVAVIAQSFTIAFYGSITWLLASAFGSILSPLPKGKPTKTREYQLGVQTALATILTFIFALSIGLDFTNEFQIIPGSISLILFLLSLQATVRRLLEFMRIRYHIPKSNSQSPDWRVRA